MHEISEGAEAKLFALNLFGKELVAKVRIPKDYRNRVIDEEIRQTRTKKEARALYNAAKAGVRVPRLVAFSKYTIYMERVQGKQLKDMPANAKTFSKIGFYLAKLHNAGIAHGDFTPANILVDGSDIYIIDFGLAEHTSSAEEKAIDLLLIKRSIERKQYRTLEKIYAKLAVDSEEVIERLAEIEKRGRYQSRTLLTA
ncbi:MAG: KEOPS complex kinase/ATPase Bud32 [Candidatus Micrarchaeaceae archaeon]